VNIIVSIVSFIADLTTAILGVFGIWLILFKRKALSRYLRIFMNSHLNERIKRIKETLGKLESLDYNDKTDRVEIRDLIGQLAGQIRPIVTEKNGLGRLYSDITDFQEKKKPLNEGYKRQLVYDLHGALDNATIGDFGKLMENDNEG
jgi:hypothetical protein